MLKIALDYKCIQFTLSDHKQWPVERNYAKHIELMNQGSKRKGCIRMPAMHFDCNKCPPDMLHLKKGIISKLVSQVVDWTVTQGKEEVLLQEMKKHKIPFVYVFFNTSETAKF